MLDSAAAHYLLDIIESDFDSVTILVNNAGIKLSQLLRLAEIDDLTFDRLFSINVKSNSDFATDECARSDINSKRFLSQHL